MWGSTFADLAKKVEQQAATMEISFPSDAVTDAVSMFNLDSMQGGGGGSSSSPSTEEQNNNADAFHEPPKPAMTAPVTPPLSSTPISMNTKPLSKKKNTPPKSSMTSSFSPVTKTTTTTTTPMSNGNSNNDFFAAAGMTMTTPTLTAIPPSTTNTTKPSDIMKKMISSSSSSLSQKIVSSSSTTTTKKNDDEVVFEEESIDDSMLETPQPKQKEAAPLTTTTTTNTTQQQQQQLPPPPPVVTTENDPTPFTKDELEKDVEDVEEETWDFDDTNVQDEVEKQEDKEDVVETTTTTEDFQVEEEKEQPLVQPIVSTNPVTTAETTSTDKVTNDETSPQNDTNSNLLNLAIAPSTDTGAASGGEWDFEDDTSGMGESNENLSLVAAAETTVGTTTTPTVATTLPDMKDTKEEGEANLVQPPSATNSDNDMISSTAVDNDDSPIDTTGDEWDFEEDIDNDADVIVEDDTNVDTVPVVEETKDETILPEPPLETPTAAKVQEELTPQPPTPVESNDTNIFETNEDEQEQQDNIVTTTTMPSPLVDESPVVVVTEEIESNGTTLVEQDDAFAKEQKDDTLVGTTPIEENEKMQLQLQTDSSLIKGEEEVFSINDDSMNDLDVMYDDESDSDDDGVNADDNADADADADADAEVTNPEQQVATPDNDNVFFSTEAVAVVAAAQEEDGDEEIMFDTPSSDPLLIDVAGGDVSNNEESSMMMSPLISPIGAVPEDVNNSQFLNQAVSDTVAASEKLDSFLHGDNGDDVEDEQYEDDKDDVTKSNNLSIENTPTSIDSELNNLAEHEETLRQELARETTIIASADVAQPTEADETNNTWPSASDAMEEPKNEFIIEDETEVEEEEEVQFVTDDQAVDTPPINATSTADVFGSSGGLMNLFYSQPVDDVGEEVAEPTSVVEDDTEVHEVTHKSMERESDETSEEAAVAKETVLEQQQQDDGVINDSFAADLDNMQEDEVLPVGTTTTADSGSNGMPQEQSESVAAAIMDKATPSSEQESLSDATKSAPDVASDQMMEQFTMQIQRLEEYYQEEMKQMERRHKEELENSSGGDHEQCVATMKEIESEFRQQLKEKDTDLKKAAQQKDGLFLKIDVLKRELEGTQKLLEERNNAMAKATKTYDLDIERLKSQHKAMEEAASARGEEVEKLKEALDASNKEVESSNEAYATLKGRVKVVATELKERRIECRTLHGEVTELKTLNESLVTQVDNLQTQLEEQKSSRAESGDNMEKMRERMEVLEGELAVAKKAINERGAVGEKAISAYKKKAQQALAAANARAAAANLAKEEAELEASASKTAADEALERARMAETNLKEAVAEADSRAQKFEDQNHQLVKDLEDTKCMLEKSDEEYQQMATELDASRAAREKLINEVNNLSNGIEEEKSKSMELKQDLNEMKRNCDDLREEAETLREEVQRSAAAAFMEGHESSKGGNADGKANARQNGQNGGNSMESEATILMLQQELNGANQAIKELKEALKGAIDNKSPKVGLTQPVASWESHESEYDEFAYVGGGINSKAHEEAYHTSTTTSGKESSKGGNDSTPLFYAIEKQAELNTARNEIARLANLLGDAEASKMDAVDAMNDMKKSMEEAEAKLRRYEKMGPGADRRLQHSSLASDMGTRNPFGAVPRMPGGVRPPMVGDDVPSNSGSTNLEYLKNIMLSYLNAKTLGERKALVPVLSAVLELTAEETANAMRNVEASGSLEGVGTSFLENLGNKVQSGNLDLSSFLS